MEPQLPNPNITPNQSPLQPKNSEQAPSRPLNGSETAANANKTEFGDTESHESKQVVVSNATKLASTLPVVIPLPAPTDDTTQALGQVAAITASNDDVMEKIWIKKSKEILKNTKGDPHMKEHEVSKLQADYMFKRYGKEVKIPDDV